MDNQPMLDLHRPRPFPLETVAQTGDGRPQIWHRRQSGRHRTRAHLCPLKAKCTTSKQGRSLCRSVDEEVLDRVRGYQATEPYQKALRKRQVWVEPLFAEAKAWHGLRRLRLRGLRNANIQGLLIAAGQNLKRLLAATGWGRRHAPCGSLLALSGALG